MIYVEDYNIIIIGIFIRYVYIYQMLDNFNDKYYICNMWYMAMVYI